MNKSELFNAIAEKTGQTKTDTGHTLNALLETIIDTVAQDQSVVLVGFGTFKSTHRAAREGRNPATGESITIDATILPKFVPGATFKARIRGQ